MPKRSAAVTRGRSEDKRREERAPPLALDELWQRIRAGAATVAGVRYQLAVSAFLLAGARGQLELQELTPEGLEDVDCRLSDDAPLLVQAKDRAATELLDAYIDRVNAVLGTVLHSPAAEEADAL
jgi:hypothetical protein